MFNLDRLEVLLIPDKFKEGKFKGQVEFGVEPKTLKIMLQMT